ncbi:MAG: CDP-glucose 4,6-dehydratase [Candidatus Marinimicrobia bacterium]|jgi:CDP-glucose 4,6-dehydratase|nr:CDP-glucose 4,6-dehydratase [Candidatus Neomarinimicrobiota bacterium]
MFADIYKGKKVLITGDTGFKGSWLALWLLELDADVYGYALPPERDEDNFVVCGLERMFHHTDGDVRELKSLLQLFDKIHPDIVFHLAAQPLVLESYNDPHETFATNVMGTVNLFEAVRLTPSVKVAINVTSDKCYKNNEWIWGYRENDPMGGKDPYSASKGASEIITSSYMSSFFKNEGTANIASVRAGNVIGAGDWAENRIIPDYFRAKKSNTELVIRNPNATRPWQHVLEPLSGYMHLASELYNMGKTFQGGWNFGPLDEMNRTVAELIEKLGKLDNNTNIVYNNTEDNLEANLLKLDISKAVSQLNWMPVLDFEETLKYTIEGYLSDLDGNSAIGDRLKTIEFYTEAAKKQKNS